MTKTEYVDMISLPSALLIMAAFVNYATLSTVPYLGIGLMFVCYYACIRNVEYLLHRSGKSVPVWMSIFIVATASMVYTLPLGYAIINSPKYTVPITSITLVVCLINVLVLYRRGYYK